MSHFWSLLHSLQKLHRKIVGQKFEAVGVRHSSAHYTPVIDVAPFGEGDWEKVEFVRLPSSVGDLLIGERPGLSCRLDEQTVAVGSSINLLPPTPCPGPV